MNSPLLSICIPTYNREKFLAWTLDKTVAAFPHAKIVVSDNASTDGTREVVKTAGARYIRQSSNIGAFPNMRAALLAASTQYCVFLGDDDYLVPEEVQKGMDFLEAHPEVSAYFAPCQLYDEVRGKPAWDAFYVASDETFDRSDTLWNFVMHKHVWPEHAIYRRKGLDKVLGPRLNAYWCFADLVNALVQGPVHFAKTPYYRNITNHPVGMRQKLGDVQCLTDFDSYRWGLEIMAFGLFSKAPDFEKMKPELQNMIRQFMWTRYEIAARLRTMNGKLPEAHELQMRMEMTRY
jgi:glycosyltransferase involved in cell wall biosynthesis